MAEWDERRIGAIEKSFDEIRRIVIGNGDVGLAEKVNTILAWIEEEKDSRRADEAERKSTRSAKVTNRVLLVCAFITMAIPGYFTIVDHFRGPQTIYIEHSTVHATEPSGAKIDSTTSSETKEKH